ncbi:MAG TPA: hydroxymethylglutaryl-CoA lyase [Trebonia sp.]|jgi:hydroxymethylglutaryl-CoA lyase|nr:hydroxymethylglutaryl-CoA lyase [Trebonia sp.]
MSLPASVTVTEVVLRDGLQDEPVTVDTDGKLRLLDGLLGAGLRSVELGAFVRPDRVPQMADTDELVARSPAPAGVTFSALVLNRAGAERAIAAGVPEVRLVVSASDGHSRANAGRSTDEALAGLERSAAVLSAAPRPPVVSAGIATAFWCPYDGRTPPERLASIAVRLAAAGIRQISLADTIGAATPVDVREAMTAVREAVPDCRIGLHLHDTLGMALACAWEALGLGVDWFDAALGGIGGCPFAPGAAGNVATEDLLGLLHGAGVDTGVDLGRLLELIPLLRDLVGHDLASRRWLARSAQWAAGPDRDGAVPGSP